MKRIKAIAGILAIFALGVLTGALATDLVIKHRIDMFHEKGPPHIGPLFMKRIGDRLDLTNDQRIAVEKILDHLETQLKEIRQGFDPKIKAAFDAAFNQIGEHLTGPQKKQLEILKKQFPKHCRPDKRFRYDEHRDDPEKTLPPDPVLPDQPPH